MKRTVKDDLIPGYTHGLHFIVDNTDTSPIRKMLLKDVVIEDASLTELTEAGPLVLANYIQKRKTNNVCNIVFLQLDSKQADRELAENLSCSTPATKLRDLFPPLLEEEADSIVYVVDNTDMVLAIKHRWCPTDVYLL